MKKIIVALIATLSSLIAMAQVEHSIILEQSTFRKVNADPLTGVNIDPIAKDLSRNACARVKIKFANMSRAEIDALSVKFQSNTDLARQQVAQYFDNVLILEMTAKQNTRFYVQSPIYGESNEVNLNLEGNCEYEMMARLNQTFSIAVNSNVEGAEVYIDNRFVARTDANHKATISGIFIGSHTLKLVYGGVVYEQQINVNKSSIQFNQNVNIAAAEPQFVVFIVEPKSAVVTINNQPYSLDDGAMQTVLDAGTYNYTVTAAGYHSQSGTFTVAGDKVEKRLSLTADSAMVTLTAPDNAEIWINGVKKGTATWRGTLNSGTYIFEARKEGYRNSRLSQRITSATASQSYTLPAPEPVYGSIMIDGTPLTADVILDGKHIGTLPLKLGNILVGTHTITISKNGYADHKQIVTITEGETANVNVTLKQGGTNANIAGFDMIYVKGGTFTMGATAEQGSDAESDEKPTHSVTLSDYYIGRYEVTQAQWRAVMGSNPSIWKGDNLPVEDVSWNDIQEFIKKLNAQTGKRFRLPTEAEWEYAARGGNQSKGYKYSGSNKIKDVAWYDRTSRGKPHPVGQKTPNELGIYDMSGNVREWCQDWYGDYSSDAQTNPTGPSSGSYRVLRGGSWNYYARFCRVSHRNLNNPDLRISNCGFRLVMEP